MKHLLKKSFNLLLSASLIFYPVQPVLAEEPINAAKKSVEQAQLAAKADAEALVATDFQTIQSQLLSELERLTKDGNTLETYNALIQKVSTEFEKMASLDVESLKEIAATSDDLEEFIKRYELSVQDLFMSQWTWDQKEATFQQARDFAQLLATDFENTCRDGRADSNKTYKSKGFDVPEYITYFEGKINIGKGNELGLTLNYGVETAGSEQAAKDRRLAIEISNGAAEITASAYLAQATGTATFTAGSTGAMLAAAAPYMIAVVAVVMIVTSVSARAEAYKIAKKVIKANEFLGTATPNHEDVSKYYRQACLDYSGLFSKVVGAFVSLPKDDTHKQKLQAAKGLESEIAIWEQQSAQFDSNVCQMNLHSTFKEFGCFDENGSENLKTLVEEKSPKAACRINRMEGTVASNIAGKVCVLPLNQSERKAKVENALAFNDAFNDKYSLSKTSDLLAAKVTLIFENQYEMKENMKTSAMKELRRHQKEALKRVIAYTRLVQQVRPLTAGESLLDEEIKIQEQYFSFRDQLLSLTVEAIQSVLGTGEKVELINSYKDFGKSLVPFYNRYNHIDEVNVLMTSYERILRELQGI